LDLWSGPRRVRDGFHAIDSLPVWWTGLEAGDWSPASAVDGDGASGVVSSLVISVVVKITFSLRRMRLRQDLSFTRPTPLHGLHRSMSGDRAGSQMGHTILSREEIASGQSAPAPAVGARF
jgi:hypothetical protein